MLWTLSTACFPRAIRVVLHVLSSAPPTGVIAERAIPFGPRCPCSPFTSIGPETSFRRAAGGGLNPRNRNCANYMDVFVRRTPESAEAKIATASGRITRRDRRSRLMKLHLVQRVG